MSSLSKFFLLLSLGLSTHGANKDRDEDGFTPNEGDCDDQNSISPVDNDGDGFSTCDGDCNDSDQRTFWCAQLGGDRLHDRRRQ